jgi:DNA-binding GntR family transcriptional regulator
MEHSIGHVESPSPLFGLNVEFVSTAQQVAEAIREQLLRGQVAPGTRLGDMALAAELKVSRNTIREAITILAAEGLVVRNLHRGASVAELSLEELKDLYRARQALEVAGVRAAESADPSWRLSLAEAFRDMELAAAADETSAVLDADRRFHEALVMPIGSERLQRFYHNIQAQIRLTRAWYGPREDSKLFVRRHRQVVSAIRADNYADAERLVTELIGAGEDRLRQQLLRPAVADEPSGDGGTSSPLSGRRKGYPRREELEPELSTGGSYVRPRRYR